MRNPGEHMVDHDIRLIADHAIPVGQSPESRRAATLSAVRRETLHRFASLQGEAADTSNGRSWIHYTLTADQLFGQPELAFSLEALLVADASCGGEPVLRLFSKETRPISFSERNITVTEVAINPTTGANYAIDAYDPDKLTPRNEGVPRFNIVDRKLVFPNYWESTPLLACKEHYQWTPGVEWQIDTAFPFGMPYDDFDNLDALCVATTILSYSDPVTPDCYGPDFK